MKTVVQTFTAVGDRVFPTVDLFLSDTGWVLPVENLIKSAASKVSEFKIFALTYDSLNSLCVRSFSLNEFEAEFNIHSEELKSLTLRDTSVHKKITFNQEGGLLTYAKGQDVVGQNSETKSFTTKEPLSEITINGNTYKTPFNLESIYEGITGQSSDLITSKDLEEEAEIANMWDSLLEQLNTEEE